MTAFFLYDSRDNCALRRLVEKDLGGPLAVRVAREMVLYLRRPGGQSQFSAAMKLQSSDRRSSVLDS